MSYSLTLPCGCDAHVSCHPITGIALTRIIERRHRNCAIRKHDVGIRVWLWELLPGGRSPYDEANSALRDRAPLR